MDRQLAGRRRFFIASLVLAAAWVTVGACEMILHEGHIALLRMDVCRRNDAAGNVLAAAFLVTTWKWFRGRPKSPSIITVSELREHQRP